MGRLTINRKPGQRVLLTPADGVDAADLLEQLTTEGIWLEVDYTERSGQLLISVTAPSGVLVLREELVAGGTPVNTTRKSSYSESV